MDSPSLEAEGKTVVLLDLALASVDDKIVALGLTHTRIFFFQPSDWMKTVDNLKQLCTSGELLAVLFLLDEQEIVRFSTPDYFEYWYELILELKKSKSLIFIAEYCFHDIIFSASSDSFFHDCIIFVNDYLECVRLFNTNYDIDVLDQKIHSLGDINIKFSETRQYSINRKNADGFIIETLLH